MRGLIFKTVALFALWLVLSQSFSAMHLGVGVLASFAIAYMNSRYSQPWGAKMRWVRVLAYLPWLLWKILQSGTHVAYLILHPRLPIDPKLIRYQSSLNRPLGVVILGNSVTLTPGTITAEVRDTEFVVHAMDDQAGDDLTSLTLERKIAGIFAIERESKQ